MDYRRFDVTINQAIDLKNTKVLFFKKPVYAMVSIVGNSSPRQRTSVAKYTSNNKLAWGSGTTSAMRFYVEESKLQQNHLVLMIQLVCKRIFGSDKIIGEVCVSMKELYDNYNKAINSISYSTHKVDCGHGYLQFSYEFDSVATAVKKEDNAATYSLMRRRTQNHVNPTAPSLEQYLIT